MSAARSWADTLPERLAQRDWAQLEHDLDADGHALLPQL